MKAYFDYEAIYLRDGVLYYIFQAGSGPAILETANKLNDGQWHTVETSREKKEGKLTIDSTDIYTGTSMGGASSVNNVASIYIGGVPEGQLYPKKYISKFNRFVGGMADIEHLPPIPSKDVNVVEGYQNVKTGISIGANGGYLREKGISEVGRDVTFTMRVSSAQRSGYLLDVRSDLKDQEDFLSLFITEDGSIKCECNNGGGVFSVSVKPSGDICDGEMHEITGVKRGSFISLTVDKTTQEVQSASVQASANTRNEPYFFGGLPETRRPEGYKPFVGCIEYIKVREKELTFDDHTKLHGEAVLGCPEAEN